MEAPAALTATLNFPDIDLGRLLEVAENQVESASPSEQISVDAAETIARATLAARIGLVVSDGDVMRGRPTWFYAAPAGFPRGYWIVRVEGDGSRTGPSTIVVIRKTDGQVVFEGEDPGE